jgi:hypothetical protein
VFYGLPEHAHFYSELLNLAEGASAGGAGAEGGDAAALQGGGGGGGGGGGAVTALFCRYDALALGRVVGAGRARKMLAAESGTFLFVAQ